MRWPRVYESQRAKRIIKQYNSRLLGSWLPLELSMKPIGVLEVLLLAYAINYGKARSPFAPTPSPADKKKPRKEIALLLNGESTMDKKQLAMTIFKATQWTQLFNPFNGPLFVLDILKFSLQAPLQRYCIANSRRSVQKVVEKLEGPQADETASSNYRMAAATALAAIDICFMVISTPIRLLKVAVWGGAEIAKSYAQSTWQTLKGIGQSAKSYTKSLWQSLWYSAKKESSSSYHMMSKIGVRANKGQAILAVAQGKSSYSPTLFASAPIQAKVDAAMLRDDPSLEATNNNPQPGSSVSS